MSTTKNLRIGRFLKVLLDFLFGFMIIVCVGLLIWVLLTPILLRKDGMLGSASVPVRIGTGDDPQFEVRVESGEEFGVADAFVRESEGMLYLETESIYLITLSNAAKLILGGGLIYTLFLLRGIVRSIVAGNPFTSDTALKVRRLGYTILVLAFLAPIVQYLAASEVLKRLVATTPALVPGPSFDAVYLLLSLLILLLAQIWSYGLDLERDRQLTV